MYHQGFAIHAVEVSVRSAEEAGGNPSLVIEDIDIMSSHLVIKGFKELIPVQSLFS